MGEFGDIVDALYPSDCIRSEEKAEIAIGVSKRASSRLRAVTTISSRPPLSDPGHSALGAPRRGCLRKAWGCAKRKRQQARKTQYKPDMTIRRIRLADNYHFSLPCRGPKLLLFIF